VCAQKPYPGTQIRRKIRLQPRRRLGFGIDTQTRQRQDLNCRAENIKVVMEESLKNLILGAHGRIARVATDLLLKQTGAQKTVSRRSVADPVVKLSMTPGFEARRGLGVHRKS
jgi:hypothetical protein